MADTHLSSLVMTGGLTAGSAIFDGGTITAAGALSTKTTIAATGNISGANLTTAGTVGATGAIKTNSNLTASGGTLTFGTQIWTFGTSAPASGTWYQGNIRWNTAPAAEGNVGWVCTAGGTAGGTWNAFGTINA